MFKLKIAVVGPTKAGKTTISNLLSDTADNLGAEYTPTIGCRILEIEQELKISNRSEKTEIEIWDCSGDSKYESCWHAFSHESNGIIFVYNPKNQTHCKELNQWYTHFVQNAGLRDEVCMVVANSFDSDDTSSSKYDKLANLFADMKIVKANLDEDSETFRGEFRDYIQRIAEYSKSKQDQEEKMILK